MKSQSQHCGPTDEYRNYEARQVHAAISIAEDKAQRFGTSWPRQYALSQDGASEKIY
jgi:hypothetical protein